MGHHINFWGKHFFHLPDANPPIWIDIGMEKLRFESHLGWVEGVVLGEGQGGDEDSVLEICSLWSGDGSFPLEKVVLSDRPSSDTWGIFW